MSGVGQGGGGCAVRLSHFVVLFSLLSSTRASCSTGKSSIFEMSEATGLGDLKCVKYNDFTLFKIAVFRVCINVNSYVCTVARIHYVQRNFLFLWMSICTYVHMDIIYMYTCTNVFMLLDKSSQTC